MLPLFFAVYREEWVSRRRQAIARARPKGGSQRGWKREREL